MNQRVSRYPPWPCGRCNGALIRLPRFKHELQVHEVKNTIFDCPRCGHQTPVNEDFVAHFKRCLSPRSIRRCTVASCKVETSRPYVIVPRCAFCRKYCQLSSVLLQRHEEYCPERPRGAVRQRTRDAAAQSLTSNVRPSTPRSTDSGVASQKSGLDESISRPIEVPLPRRDCNRIGRSRSRHRADPVTKLMDLSAVPPPQYYNVMSGTRPKTDFIASSITRTIVNPSADSGKNSRQRRVARRSAKRHADLSASHSDEEITQPSYINQLSSAARRSHSSSSSPSRKRVATKSNSTKGSPLLDDSSILYTALRESTPLVTSALTNSTKSLHRTLSTMSISEPDTDKIHYDYSLTKSQVMMKTSLEKCVSTPNLADESEMTSSKNQITPAEPALELIISSPQKIESSICMSNTASQISSLITADTDDSSDVIEQDCRGFLRNIRPDYRTIEGTLAINAHLIPGEYEIIIPIYPFRILGYFSVNSSHPSFNESWEKNLATNPNNYAFVADILDYGAHPIELLGTLALNRSPYPGHHVLRTIEGPFCNLIVSTEGLWTAAPT